MIKPNIAPCGLDCDKCRVYIATMTDDTESLLKVGAEWGKRHNFDFVLAAEDVKCDGCRTPGGRIWLGCRDCALRLCEKGKDLQNCAHCASFPCDHTKAFEARFSTDRLTQASAALKQQ